MLSNLAENLGWDRNTFLLLGTSLSYSFNISARNSIIDVEKEDIVIEYIAN